MKTNIPKLISNYFYLKPNPKDKNERVSFGTSGHRGSANNKTFNEEHIFAIAQAIADYKKEKSITGAVFIGKDTHALSTPAEMSAIRVLCANDIEVVINNDYTPTPVISHTIIEHNKKNKNSDGIVITPSHNPPEDGGFKYNAINGGASETNITKTIEKKANFYLENKNYKTIDYEIALKKIKTDDFITPYVKNLNKIVDMDLIKNSKLKIAADPLGGSAIPVYKKINEIWGVDFDIKDGEVDFTFSFMPSDKDGKIRMDCSSPYAMKNLLKLKDNYDLAFGNDTDSDRHGIVTPKGGLINPNHYLTVAMWYLFKHRNWPKHLKVGKTVVTSSMIDRVADSLGVEVYETPVGFKYFAEGLYEGQLGFAGEESAGASFLRYDASPWSSDKDGIIMNLLAIEIMAKTKKDIADIYAAFEDKFGKSYYKRVDAPATKKQKEILKSITHLNIKTLAGEKIEKIYTKAPGNNEPIGGMKIVTKNSWMAFRPSGTEDIYKIYAESFISEEHLEAIIKEIQEELQKIFEELK
ncbi:alpha-D-glucose phosphate-specific phosphoglucomutase [Lebetimonas sp. JS032]|uniref:alpha-D-glucose phosphate-specific phosphoglucomutase n=1 Tax=Lebetimonas sp. JS032 TaxID=990070 RepID=UPI00046786F8|nr:alpha-D-glucose phosphate-specific phosphoglucomutase [Lebetimonas sp. JS032]